VDELAKIMVVDDEAEVRRAVRRMLEKEGHEVSEAEGGRECLEKLRGERPDLVLLDVMMPDMEGWDVCRKIKEDEETKDVIVAMLTIRTEDKDKVTSLDYALADWHINKPFKGESLPETVEWLLQRPIRRR
jgi:DNA-binding response OmpR family regulator